VKGIFTGVFKVSNCNKKAFLTLPFYPQLFPWNQPPAVWAMCQKTLSSRACVALTISVLRQEGCGGSMVQAATSTTTSLTVHGVKVHWRWRHQL